MDLMLASMETYEFLSEQWITTVRQLREEWLAANTPPTAPKLRLNLIIESVPFGDGTVDAHLDTSSGTVELETGHLDKVDATITTDYATAKSLFVDGRMSAALEAMQLGRIKVKGNMFKLLGLGKIGNDPASEKLTEQIRAITS